MGQLRSRDDAVQLLAIISDWSHPQVTNVSDET
jgi:hypothetical protein